MSSTVDEGVSLDGGVRTFFSASFWRVKSASVREVRGVLPRNPRSRTRGEDPEETRSTTYSLCVTHVDGVVDAVATFPMCCSKLQSSGC